MKKRQALFALANTRMSRDDRQDQIFALLANTGIPLSAREIASSIGLKNSRYTRVLLAEMVDNGEVETDLKREIMNIKPTRFYWVRDIR